MPPSPLLAFAAPAAAAAATPDALLLRVHAPLSLSLRARARRFVRSTINLASHTSTDSPKSVSLFLRATTY